MSAIYPGLRNPFRAAQFLLCRPSFGLASKRIFLKFYAERTRRGRRWKSDEKRWTLISLHVYLFVISVPIHLLWEVAQIGAYDFPEISLVTAAIGCFVPSLGDGLMTLIIYWTGWLVFQQWHWVLRPGIRGYLMIMGMGLVLAVLVELNALYRTGAWAYNHRMITIPFLEVGVSPLLQMVILPPVTVLLLQRIWKNRT